MLVDSHCHLDRIDPGKVGCSLDEMLDNARARGVTRFLSVGVDLDSSRGLLALAEQHSDVWVSVGVHPLQETAQPVPVVDLLVELGSHPGVVAIGETGLDNHYGADSAGWQTESFVHHLQAASQVRKPLIVHTRQAREQTLALLREHACRDSGGVLHCFTEDWPMAKAALDLNFYISFSGIITFASASDLREVVKQVPLDRLLVETDSPWLAPVPYRGKQNQPAYVVEVARQVAELKGMSLEAVAEATTANFYRLFGEKSDVRCET